MRICSLQSGTSADGIDVLVADVELVEHIVSLRVIDERTVPWQEEIRNDILRAARGDAFTAAEWCALDMRLGEAFANAAELAPRSDLVVSHGQTVYHWVEDGHARGTLQLGEPSLIAERVAAPVLSHLRHADIAAGGEGAPLMSLFDRLWLGEESAALRRPIATVNIGGIANAQLVRPDGSVLAFDTGPGNGILDEIAARASGGRAAYDMDAALARSGRVDQALLTALRGHPYFAARAPKSTGRETFHLGLVDEVLAERTVQPSNADIARTLVELTALTIADALASEGPAEIICSGGGVHNPLLMSRLAELAAPVPVVSSAHRGLDPDMKESLLFVLVGVFAWFGVPARFASDTARVPGRLSPGPQALRLPPSLSDITRIEILHDPS